MIEIFFTFGGPVTPEKLMKSHKFGKWWFFTLLVIGLILGVMIIISAYCSSLDLLSKNPTDYLGSAILLITFFAIILYTKFSADLAVMNESMAKTQNLALKDRQTPKIIALFPSSSADKLHITIKMQNLTPHKVKVELDLNLHYRNNKIPIGDGFYNRSKEWFLNPMECFQGHWDLKDDIKAYGADFEEIRRIEKAQLHDTINDITDKWKILYFAPKVKLTSEFGISYELWQRVFYYDFGNDTVFPYPGLE